MTQERDLYRLQAEILELVARGQDLQVCLDRLCSLVGETVTECICSIMRLHPAKNTLDVLAAPGVPPELIEMLNGLVPSELAGSCGTAVYLGEPVFVSDTSCDPRWAAMLGVAEEYNIQACWSVPIFSHNGDVLGSFAISHGVSREPDDFHREVLKSASHLAGIVIDRDRELKRAQASEKAVRQTQKLESIGVLASGIAHDFNNLLVGIMGNAHLARIGADADTKSARAIDRIEAAGRSAADLTNQLLAHAGQGRLSMEPLGLGSLARSMIGLLAATTRAPIEIKTPDANDPVVVGDSSQITQVLMNLLTNAIDATGENGGDIAVTFGVVDADREMLRGCIGGHELPAGRYAFAEVADTGIGMDAETLERIFDPFFSTKANGRGLGLAATLGIVHAHKGCLSVKSEAGVGTTFRMLCPAVEDVALAQSEQDPPTQDEVPSLRDLTVLAVDDEEMVLGVLRRMLEHAGAHVVAAGSGKEALDMLSRHPEVNAVILDLTMPGLTGPEAFESLRAERPDLPVVFCSGQSPDGCSELVHENAHTAFLAKPFVPEQLAAALEEAVSLRPTAQS